jgi:hypothetical protein
VKRSFLNRLLRTIEPSLRRDPAAGRPVAAEPPVVTEPLEPRRLFAVTFPSTAGLEFQTNGPQRPPTIGDWYTTATSASTDRAHYALIEVTPEMLAAGGGTVGITVNDAESCDDPGLLDEVNNASDPTRFQLMAADRATVLASTTLPSGTANATPVNFSVTTPGTYYVQSVTGAGPISGDNTPGLNDDDNSYSITVSQNGGLLGQYQATFQPTGPADDATLYFIVGPGTTGLFLRNFDLDGAPVTYTRPSGGTIAGTSSGSGKWNGPSPTLDAGGDTITGLSAADAGLWRVTLGSLATGNQTIFEPNDGNGRRIVLLDAAPLSGGNFSIGPDGTLTAAAGGGASVDHPFVVTNNFATSDVVNLTTAGTAAGFTVQLLDAAGVPLTDTTGDGVVDTGVLQPGEARNLILRVTPAAGTVGSDATVVRGVSFLDQQIDPVANVTRTTTKTTIAPAAPVVPVAVRPAIADAIVDYGFLRSRDATLTGRIIPSDPGPHRVRINWGDGKVTFVDLAAGQTEFSTEHRYTHGNRRRPVRLTVTNNTTGLSSDEFIARTRSQALVTAAYQDELGRDPTAKELKRLSRKFDRCRSSESLTEQTADLRERLRGG